MLKNPKFYKVLGILLFVSSAIISVMYTVSGVIGFIPTLIALVQGSVIEAVKSGFTYIAVSIQGIAWKIFFGTLALIAFCLSIIFTMGFNINMTNKVKNENLYQSDKYAQQQKATQTKQDLYEQTKNSLEDKKTQRDSQIKGMEKTRDAWGSSYKTAKSLEQDKINSVNAKYNAEIEKEQDKLSKLAEELQNVTSEEVAEEGYISMYQLFSKKMNDFTSNKKTENKPWTPEDIEFWLTTAISLFIEFAGIGCILRSEYLSQLEKISPLPTTQREAPPITTEANSKARITYDHDYKPTFDSTKPTDTTTHNTITCLTGDSVDKPKRTIGFQVGATACTGADGGSKKKYDDEKSVESLSQTKLEGFSKADLLQYIDFMYQYQKPNNESPGFKKIFENVGTGSKLEDFRKIRGFLERLDVISTDGLKTRILCTREECLKKI